MLRRKASTRSRDARTDSSRDVVGEHRHDVDRLQVGHKPDPLERRHVEVLLAVPEVVDVAVDVERAVEGERGHGLELRAGARVAGEVVVGGLEKLVTVVFEVDTAAEDVLGELARRAEVDRARARQLVEDDELQAGVAKRLARSTRRCRVGAAGLVTARTSRRARPAPAMSGQAADAAALGTETVQMNGGGAGALARSTAR